MGGQEGGQATVAHCGSTALFGRQESGPQLQIPQQLEAADRGGQKGRPRTLRVSSGRPPANHTTDLSDGHK